MTQGQWTDSPSSIGDQWEECRASGSGCTAIAGATGQTLHAHGERRRRDDPRPGDGRQRVGLRAARRSPAQTASVVSDVPKISGFTPTSAITGGSVTIDGTALNGASAVAFGTAAASFKVLSPTQIEATVPDGLRRAGKISVSTPVGTAKSAGKFTPTLSVTGFTPASGAPGRRVTIKGVGFNSSSTVSFDGVPGQRDLRLPDEAEGNGACRSGRRSDHRDQHGGAHRHGRQRRRLRAHLSRAARETVAGPARDRGEAGSRPS